MSGVIDVPTGYERITGLSSAKGFTAAARKNANVALIQAETVPIRYRDDGSDPTASEGMRLPINTFHEIRSDLSKFKAIEVDDSATLFVLYYYRAEDKM